MTGVGVVVIREPLGVLEIRLACVVCAVFVAMFVVQYTAFARWWRYPPGRTIVALDILIVTASSLVAVFLRDVSFAVTWGAAAVAWSVFAIGPVMFWRQLVFMREHGTWRPGWHEGERQVPFGLSEAEIRHDHRHEHAHGAGKPQGVPQGVPQGTPEGTPHGKPEGE